MKFKYIGQSGFKDLTLGFYEIMNPDEVLMNGDIIEIPDSNMELIESMKLMGVYKVYNKPLKNTKKDKKQKKEDKK